MELFADSIAFVTRLSTETLIIVFVLIGLFALALYFGKEWMVSFIVSLFGAAFIAQAFPFDIGQGSNGYYSFGIVVAIAVFSAFFLKKFVNSEFPYKRAKKLTQAAFLSVAGTVALFSTGLLSVYAFSGFVTGWFTGNFAFWSMLVPFAILFFIIRH